MQKTKFDTSSLGLILIITVLSTLTILRPSKLILPGGIEAEWIEEVKSIKKSLRKYAVFRDGRVILSTFDENEMKISVTKTKLDDADYTWPEVVLYFVRKPVYFEIRSSEGDGFGCKEFDSSQTKFNFATKCRPSSTTDRDLTTLIVEAYLKL